MPAGFVLVGAYLDGDGDLCHVFVTAPGARIHETLGFLALGNEAWREQARRWIHDEDDE